MPITKEIGAAAVRLRELTEAATWAADRVTSTIKEIEAYYEELRECVEDANEIARDIDEVLDDILWRLNEIE